MAIPKREIKPSAIASMLTKKELQLLGDAFKEASKKDAEGLSEFIKDKTGIQIDHAAEDKLTAAQWADLKVFENENKAHLQQYLPGAEHEAVPAADSAPPGGIKTPEPPSTPPREDGPLKRIIANTRYFFTSQTSPIHRQEAKEKYWILWRELEAAIYEQATSITNFTFRGLNKKNPESVDAVLQHFLEVKMSDNAACDEKTKAFGNLLLYARILAKQNLNKLNDAETLNMLWRDITFVRSRLLTDGIIPDNRLQDHLEYCRLECSKVCPDSESGIEEMCHETALQLVDSSEPANQGTANKANNKKARRSIALILAKLNHIRLTDINTQLRVKKIYNIAFIFLVILSLPLLHLNERLTNEYVPYWVAWDQFLNTINWWDPASWVLAPLDAILFTLQNNLLVFIFFAGLLGGFFSTVMQLRSKKVNVGDVYLRSYLLTKPIVGALGATILYIIIKSNIVSMDLGQIAIIESISYNSVMYGPLGFAFGFIMGFSERIILPSIDSESKNKSV